MTTKSSKSESKTPVKRKRATTVKLQDEKVDSIVKEITENLKNSNESKEKLEEEIKLEVKEKIGEEGEVDKNKEEKIEEPAEKDSKGEKADSDGKDDLSEKEDVKEETLNEKADGEKVSEDEKNPEEPEVKKEGAAIFAPDKNENPFPPIDQDNRKSFKWPLIYFILFLAGMVAGFIVFDQLSQRTGGNPINIAQKPTPTSEPTATPTPTKPDFSKYSIMVENGSGISGVAADTQTQLQNAGFTVNEIGNADKSTYKETVIQVKNGTNTDFLKALKAELAKTYVIAKDTEELPDSEEFDAVVIVGSDQASDQ